MRAIAIIPAKGYSRRIPNKNMRMFKGKPLIQYTIEAAKGCRQLAIVVSTDDRRIGVHAKCEGVDVIQRPAELCQDDVHAVEATLHVLKHYPDFDYVIQLLPTNPFRTVDTIHAVLNLSMAHERNVLTVTGTGKVPAHGRLLDPVGELIDLYGSQDNFQFDPYSEMVLMNGAVSCGPVKDLLKNRTFHVNPMGFVMGKREGWELDSLEDWEMGECL